MEPFGTSTAPVSMPAPAAPATLPAPPMPPVPVPVPPPVVTPSVFESKLTRKKPRQPVPVMNILLSLLLAFLVIVVALYFWGAHLANQSA